MNNPVLVLVLLVIAVAIFLVVKRRNKANAHFTESFARALKHTADEAERTFTSQSDLISTVLGERTHLSIRESVVARILGSGLIVIPIMIEREAGHARFPLSNEDLIQFASGASAASVDAQNLSPEIRSQLESDQRAAMLTLIGALKKERLEFGAGADEISALWAKLFTPANGAFSERARERIEDFATQYYSSGMMMVLANHPSFAKGR